MKENGFIPEPLTPEDCHIYCDPSHEDGDFGVTIDLKNIEEKYLNLHEYINGQEWRVYHFSNFYLSSIQQGIQAAHAQMELFNKYTPNLGNDNSIDDEPAIDMLFEWSTRHKTMICLNGGINSDLEEIKNMMINSENIYPWSYFKEDEQSLNGLLTNIAIVLPERIFGTAERIRKRKIFIRGNDVIEIEQSESRQIVPMERVIDTLTDFEIQLIEVLNGCGLAK
jgi:hypothetical protein